MKHPKFIIRRLITIGLIVVAIVSFNFSAAAAETKRVALLPFKINSDKDLSFLQDGIFDMLSTRLAKDGQIEIIDRIEAEAAMQSAAGSGAVNEASARKIGTALNADFVLFGSLTVLGSNVSIDAKMVDITGDKPTMSFFDQSQDLGAVITKINLIAANINDKMFGQTPVAAQTKTPAPAPAAAPQKTPKSGIHAHPESLLKDDGFVQQSRESDGSFEMASGVRESQASFWKSASFKFVINAVAIGDVDGDGKNETLVAAPHSLTIFRSENDRFRKLAEIDEGNNKNIYGVDIADINGNGYGEIFVTSFNSARTIVNSFVLEYDGKKYTKILDDSRLIYRVAMTPTRGRVLLGQRPMKGSSNSGRIFDMAFQAGEYVPTDDLRTPKKTSLLGLTIGDVLNNGSESAICYKKDDRLLILDSSGSQVWDSAERYGGSMLYWDAPWSEQGMVENKQYFPMRLALWHNIADKETQVIVIKNHEFSGRKLEYRVFTKTSIEAFTWDGLGLKPLWRTRTIRGHIQDYAVGDFDNDGQDEIVSGLVIKEGRISLIEDPKSTIIAYNLASAPKTETTKQLE